MPALPIDTDQIVITASRAPEKQQEAAASVTLLDEQVLERLGEPLIPALLRLAPSVAVTTQGPAGLLTEVRIRGAENNHTLLFIDGIKANDPATGDFARFELLNADLASRLEIVRGPQSALWGSQAIGGVVAVNGTEEERGFRGNAEAGSFGLRRGSVAAASASEQTSVGGAVGWQQSDGVDSFGRGDRDGYRNLSGRLRATVAPDPEVELGASAFALTGRSQFDGYDPFTFERADTLDNSRNRFAAARIWAAYGSDSSDWIAKVGAALVSSSNRNLLDDDPVNRTRGTRRTIDAQVERRFATGSVDHRLILAAEAERETFKARDTIYLGATDQDRSRTHHAVTGEWKLEAGPVSADVALRRDIFNRFKDATSLRAGGVVKVGGGFSLAASYAEGIAQPTFFDLYGFFPGNFIGNPDLKPEKSRGFEGSLRINRAHFAAALTAYRQRLDDEIVDNATFTSAVNAPGVSRRRGVEAEIAWQPVDQLRVTGTYAYLRATQPNAVTNRQLEEWRRPRHSGSLAADGSAGMLSYGASLAFVGKHLDRQEVFPFAIVRLDSYWLANARVGYRVAPRFELFARGSNLLDESYEDSAGYRTEGRGLFVGVRLADRRSSR